MESLSDIERDLRDRADCVERHGDRETHNDGVAMLLRSIADRIEAVRNKPSNAAPNITFVQKRENQERSSIARVEAYLSLPAAERWARRDTLTKKEQAMARDLWLKIKCQRPVYHSAMAY